MTITFWMPQAPLGRVAPFADEPDFFTQESVEPFLEINMTAGNGNAILALISPEDCSDEYDPCGEWDQQKLARVRTNTIKALNTKIKERAVTPTVTDNTPGQCRMVYFGRSEDYVTVRLEQFLALTKVAMEHGFNVNFG